MRALHLVLFPTLLPGCMVVAIEDGFIVDEPVDAVVVELSNGELSVEGSTHDATVVEVEFGGLTFDDVGHEVVDGVLYIDFDCGVTCGGELELSVPADAELYLDVGSGEVSARFDVAPPLLDIDLGAGDVNVQVPEGGYVLNLQAGAGSIETDGVWDEQGAAHLIAVSAGAGSIAIEGR